MKTICDIFGHTKPIYFRYAIKNKDGSYMTLRCGKCHWLIDTKLSGKKNGDKHSCGGILKVHREERSWYCDTCGYNKDLYERTR